MGLHLHHSQVKSRLDALTPCKRLVEATRELDRSGIMDLGKEPDDAINVSCHLGCLDFGETGVEHDASDTWFVDCAKHPGERFGRALIARFGSAAGIGNQWVSFERKFPRRSSVATEVENCGSMAEQNVLEVEERRGPYLFERKTILQTRRPQSLSDGLHLTIEARAVVSVRIRTDE